MFTVISYAVIAVMLSYAVCPIIQDGVFLKKMLRQKMSVNVILTVKNFTGNATGEHTSF